MNIRACTTSLMLLMASAAYAQTPVATPPAPAIGPQSEINAKGVRTTGLYVTLRVKPGRNAEFEAAYAQMEQGMRESEPGALYYDLFTTVQDPQLYVIMERYTDPAAVAVHNKSEHLKKVLAAIKDLMEGPPEAQRLILVSSK